MLILALLVGWLVLIPFAALAWGRVAGFGDRPSAPRSERPLEVATVGRTAEVSAEPVLTS